MNNNSIGKIKSFLNKKGTASYVITRLAKTGHIAATQAELNTTNSYIYEAYKPLLDRKEVTKKGFLDNPKHIALYREEYIGYLRNMRQVKHSDIFDEQGNVDIEKATKELEKSNTDWLTLQDTLHQNDQEPMVKKKIQEEVHYNIYVILPEEKRKQLIRIAADQNRTEDKAIYSTLEPYIREKEGVSSLEYLDSSELREKYRNIYSKVKTELGKENAKGKFSFETVDEAIKRIADEAANMLFNKRNIEGRVELEEVQSLEELARLTPMELSNLKMTYMDGFTTAQHRRIEEQEEKRINELNKLQEMNERNNRVLNGIFSDYYQSQAARMASDAKKFEEIREKYSNPRKGK